MTTESDRPAEQASDLHDAATPASGRASPDTPPRLSVGHLLLLTACYALYLSAVRSQAKAEPGLVGALLVCVFALGPGVAWAGCAVFLWRRWRGARWPVEPGHWLLAVIGAQAALEVILQLLPEGLFRSPGAVSTAFTACFLVVPALSRKLPAAWKGLFCLLAGLCAAPLLLVCLSFAFPIEGKIVDQVARLAVAAKPVAAMSLVLGLEAWERFHGTSRNWLHGLGVVAFVWMMLAPLLVAALL